MINTVLNFIGEGDSARLIFGSVVFLITVTHVTCVFVLILSFLLQKKYPRKRFVAMSLLIGVLGHAGWLMYAWDVRDLFVKISLALWLMTYLIFFIHAVGRKETIARKD